MDYSRHFHSIGPSFSSQIETHECLSSLRSPNCSRLSSPDNSWSSTASLSWIIFVQKVLLLKKIDSHSNSITYSITNVLSYVCIACATYFSEGHYTSYQKWHFWECFYFLFTYIRRSISQVPVAETSFFFFLSVWYLHNKITVFHTIRREQKDRVGKTSSRDSANQIRTSRVCWHLLSCFFCPL